MRDFGDYTFERYDPFNSRHIQFGDSLESMRKTENPVMLPLGAEVMAVHTLGIIVSQNNTAVGYNGIILEYEGGVGEMGGLYINPDFRGRGLVRPLKSELFTVVKSTNRIKRLLTFANKNSLRLNLDLGFRPAEDDEIPSQSLAVCSGCPEFCNTQKLGLICCDTILTLETEHLPDLSSPNRTSKA